MDDFVQSQPNHLKTYFNRPYLVLQQPGHESFEEIEHLDELKCNEFYLNDEFKLKIWCPFCNNDLTNKIDSNKNLSNDSFSQYLTARSRTSSSSYIDLSSLSSGNSNVTVKKPTRRSSVQPNYNDDSLVISPRFSSTTRKSVRQKEQSKKSDSSINITQNKSPTLSIDSRSKTTSNSTSKSILSNIENYNVETYYNKNKQTGSIKQLTVIRYYFKSSGVL